MSIAYTRHPEKERCLLVINQLLTNDNEHVATPI